MTRAAAHRLARHLRRLGYRARVRKAIEQGVLFALRLDSTLSRSSNGDRKKASLGLGNTPRVFSYPEVMQLISNDHAR